MAMLFMLEERLCQKENHPLLSCSDIETLLAQFLPRQTLPLKKWFARWKPDTKLAEKP